MQIRASRAALMLLALMVLIACTAPSATRQPVAPNGATGTLRVAEIVAATLTPLQQSDLFLPHVSGSARTAPSPIALPPKSPAGNIIRSRISAEPHSLDPLQVVSADEIQFVMLNYLPLMTLGPDLQVHLGAAESYELSADSLHYTFKLRPNVRYADGVPLTAHNFEYALKRWADPDRTGPHQALGFPIVGFQDYAQPSRHLRNGITFAEYQVAMQQLRDSVGIEALDDMTLAIHLERPVPYFLTLLALWFTAPVREELVTAGGDEWHQHPTYYVGNGPFQLTAWARGAARAVWRRNDHYALVTKKPAIDGIEINIIRDDGAALTAYRNGELDLLEITGAMLSSKEEKAFLLNEIQHHSDACGFYLGYHVQQPPLDNKLVRQAFAYAIDRDAFRREFLYDAGETTLSLIPRGIPGHTPDEKRFGFDPTKARATLAAAGYPGGQGISIELPFMVSYDPESARRTKARFAWLADQLRLQLGVRVDLQPFEDSFTHSPTHRRPIPPLQFLWLCPDYPGPQNYLGAMFRSNGAGAARIGYTNAKLDWVVDEIDRTQEPTQRMTLVKQAHDILIEDQPITSLNTYYRQELQKPWISGIQRTSFDYFPGIFSLNTISVSY